MCRTCLVASSSKLDLCQRFYGASAAEFKPGATLACARHVLSWASLVFAVLDALACLQRLHYIFARAKQLILSSALDIASQGLHGRTGCFLCAHPQRTSARDIPSQGLHGLTGCCLCAHPPRPRAAPAGGCSHPAPFKQGPRLLPPGTPQILLGLVLSVEALKDRESRKYRIALPHVPFAILPVPRVHASLVIDSSKHHIKVLLPEVRWSIGRLFHMFSRAQERRRQ